MTDPDAPTAAAVTPSSDAPAAAAPAVRPPDRRLRRERTRKAFRAVKAQHAAHMTGMERVANRLTIGASSTPFLLFHFVWFAVWITWNTARGPQAFDPFPFGLLTMIVSLEAIVLSIFVLLTQNRESAIAEVREEVALAVALRVEEEVTKVLQLIVGLYTRSGHHLAVDPELVEMLEPLDPDAIERELVEQIRLSMEGRRQAT